MALKLKPKGKNGEIVVHIPSGLDNGKITIELTNLKIL